MNSCRTYAQTHGWTDTQTPYKMNHPSTLYRCGQNFFYPVFSCSHKTFCSDNSLKSYILSNLFENHSARLTILFSLCNLCILGFEFCLLQKYHHWDTNKTLFRKNLDTNFYKLRLFQLNGPFPNPLILFCNFNIIGSKMNLPKTGFKPRTSGVGSNRSTNCATRTAQRLFLST